MADNLQGFGPSNIETLLTTTIENRRGDIKDAIFNKMPLLDHLNRKAKVSVKGGASLVYPIMYGKNSTVDAYSGDDIIDTTRQEGFTAMQYEWKQYAGSVSVTGREARIQNAGPEAIHSLIDAKQRQLEKSLKDKLHQDLFASSLGTNNMNTLVTLIDATSTIGEINSTTYSWWQANADTSGAAFSSTGLSRMRSMHSTLVQRGEAPTIIVTTTTVHDAYEAELQDQIRYENYQDVDGSFRALNFRGIPVVPDNLCTSGVMYFLNSNVLEFVVHAGTDFKMTEFVKPANQDVKIAQLLWAGQLATTNRRLLGKMTAIS